MDGVDQSSEDLTSTSAILTCYLNKSTLFTSPATNKLWSYVSASKTLASILEGEQRYKEYLAKKRIQLSNPQLNIKEFEGVIIDEHSSPVVALIVYEDATMDHILTSISNSIVEKKVQLVKHSTFGMFIFSTNERD